MYFEVWDSPARFDLSVVAPIIAVIVTMPWFTVLPWIGIQLFTSIDRSLLKFIDVVDVVSLIVLVIMGDVVFMAAHFNFADQYRAAKSGLPFELIIPLLIALEESVVWFFTCREIIQQSREEDLFQEACL